MIIVGVATALSSTAMVIYLHVPMLFWDEWYMTSDFQSYSAGTFEPSALIEQHNEHRILLSRLIYLVDLSYFNLRGYTNILAILLLQIFNSTMLIYIMSRRIINYMHRIMLTGFILAMLFTLRQEQNFTNGFQVCFIGVFAASLLGIVAYVGGLEKLKSGRGRPWGRFAWAALACAISAYTMANGVLTGFVLVVVALLWRAPWWIPAVTLALSAALAWLFFRDYVPGAGPPLSQAIGDPLPYASYIAAYLGNFLDSNTQTAQILGGFGLLAAAAGAFRVATGRERQPASLMLLAIAGCCVATAAATAFGRISLGIEQASESRYATFTEIFWTALVLFWFPVAPYTRKPWLSAVGMIAVIALLSLSAVYYEITAWPVLAARATALHHVSDSLLSGLFDAKAATYENTPKDDISRYLPFLRDHRLSLFAEPMAQAYGEEIAALGRVSPSGTCRGTLKAEADTSLGQAGVRLSGYVREEKSSKIPRRILIVAKTGEVVGFGSASLPGEKARNWSGYAESGVGDTLDAYARLGDGSVCDLGTTDVRPSAND